MSDTTKDMLEALDASAQRERDEQEAYLAYLKWYNEDYQTNK